MSEIICQNGSSKLLIEIEIVFFFHSNPDSCLLIFFKNFIENLYVIINNCILQLFNKYIRNIRKGIKMKQMKF